MFRFLVLGGVAAIGLWFTASALGIRRQQYAIDLARMNGGSGDEEWLRRYGTKGVRKYY